MTSSARATYSAVSAGNGFFNYEVKLENTSTGSYDIYSLMLGSQYSVPIGGPVLSDAVPVSAPPGWTGYATTVGIAWQTSFRTNSMDSGYILEGTASTFRFSSSTAPPPTADCPFTKML